MNNVHKTTKKTVRDLMKSEQFASEIQSALPSVLTKDRFLRVALTTLQKTPQLQKCEDASLCQALLDCASLGLEPDNRRAHLIPYGKNVQLIVDYKGLVELVMRNGDVKRLHADVVHENDSFEYDRGEVKKHVIHFGKDRGEIICVYAEATLSDGTTKAEVMDVTQINAIRNASKAAKSGPWVNHWGEMAKKTVFKRLSKWLPLSPEVRDAAEADDVDPIINAKPVVASPVFDEADFLPPPELDEIPMDDKPQTETKPNAA